MTVYAKGEITRNAENLFHLTEPQCYVNSMHALNWVLISDISLNHGVFITDYIVQNATVYVSD